MLNEENDEKSVRYPFMPGNGTGDDAGNDLHGEGGNNG